MLPSLSRPAFGNFPCRDEASKILLSRGAHEVVLMRTLVTLELGVVGEYPSADPAVARELQRPMAPLH